MSPPPRSFPALSKPPKNCLLASLTTLDYSGMLPPPPAHSIITAKSFSKSPLHIPLQISVQWIEVMASRVAILGCLYRRCTLIAHLLHLQYGLAFLKNAFSVDSQRTEMRITRSYYPLKRITRSYYLRFTDEKTEVLRGQLLHQGHKPCFPGPVHFP